MVVNKVIEKIIENVKEKQLLKRYTGMLIVLFISAISYNLLSYPAKIVSGGTSGLSILIEEVFHITPAYFMLVFQVIVLVLAIFVLGFEKASGSILATFIYPLFVDLTSGITTIISVNSEDMLLISLYIGIISGFVSGIVYKMGFSNGGISLINQILHEKYHISISKCNFIINIFIVVLGGVIFGFANLMYAVIVLFVSGIITDKILLGISNNKVFYIITSKDKEVKNFILNEMGHGITEFKATTGYKEDKKEVLMTAIPTKEYVRVTEEIKKIDNQVFFVVADSYQVSDSA